MVLESPDLIALPGPWPGPRPGWITRRTVATGCAQYDALGGEASPVVTVTEPGRAGQGQDPAAGDPGIVTWAGSLGDAGRGALISTGIAGCGALVSDPARPCQPWEQRAHASRLQGLRSVGRWPNPCPLLSLQLCPALATAVMLFAQLSAARVAGGRPAETVHGQDGGPRSAAAALPLRVSPPLPDDSEDTPARARAHPPGSIAIR
jgi:hypothetical protein